MHNTNRPREHVGLCAEFPGLVWLDASPDAAFAGIRQLVADVLRDLKRSGEQPPQPLATRAFSGFAAEVFFFSPQKGAKTARYP